MFLLKKVFKAAKAYFSEVIGLRFFTVNAGVDYIEHIGYAPSRQTLQ
jgi:hypothetical protein